MKLQVKITLLVFVTGRNFKFSVLKVALQINCCIRIFSIILFFHLFQCMYSARLDFESSSNVNVATYKVRNTYSEIIFSLSHIENKKYERFSDTKTPYSYTILIFYLFKCWALNIFSLIQFIIFYGVRFTLHNYAHLHAFGAWNYVNEHRNTS